MRVLPVSYNVRSVRRRWRTSLLAVSGIALVVAVFAVLSSLAEGFAIALRTTGRRDNAIVVQRGSSSEVMSTVGLDERNVLLTDPRVARGRDGRPEASWDMVVLLSLPRKSDGRRTSVTLRAVSPQTFDVRGGIRVVSGRRFKPGLDEVMVGRRLLERVRGLEPGGLLKAQHKEFRIVGAFASEGAAFESEVWGDFNAVAAAFHRGPAASSVVLRMKDPAEVPALDRWIRNQPGWMRLRAAVEGEYYEEQAGPISRILKALAAFVAVTMGIGAVFGAMNTMYAVVAARTREIGTLRALGFSRRAVLVSCVLESACVALVGGVLGCVLALPMNGFSTGTAITQSFSEVAFAFRITPRIMASALGFAVVMGVAGGLLPSLRAARLPIAGALREG